MKVIIICGDHPRNYCFLEYLKQIPEVQILRLFLFKRENIMPNPPSDLDLSLKKLWNLHFEKRREAENKRFKFELTGNFEEQNIISISNIKELLKHQDLLKKINPDICIISGIPILENKILSILPKFTINLHLGLIPYYKGAITMFWPFLFLEPTMAGTTFHIINNKLDTGEILHNNVPKLEKNDGIHDVASKAVVEASKDIHLVIKHLDYRIKNKIEPHYDNSLISKGKLFYKSDWKPSMLKIIYETFEDKIVDLYLNKNIFSKKPELKKLNI